MIAVKNLPVSLRNEDLVERLSEICAGNEIVFVGIFGSYLKDEQTDASDIDLMIEFREGSRKSLLDIVRIEAELSYVFGKKVDLLTPGGISPYLKDEIINSMKVVYEER